MKYIYSMAIIFLCSCAYNSKNEVINSKNEIIESHNSDVDSMKGLWISEQFLFSLVKNKNSNLSANNINLSLIEFKKNNSVSIIWNFYEGTDYIYKKIADSLLFYSENKKVLNFYYDKNINKIINKEGKLFVPIPSKNIIEETLFQGSYKDQHNNKVQFSKNGKILGLKNINHYSFEFQNSLSDSSYNIMYLRDSQESDNKFVYKIDSIGNIEIFNLICSDITDDESCKIGKIFLKLVKE